MLTRNAMLCAGRNERGLCEYIYIPYNRSRDHIIGHSTNKAMSEVSNCFGETFSCLGVTMGFL